jgi:CheY-like chemotaxis protein/anti-sigma regulatory factor (Ser/Thr protein kinase)
VKQVVINLLSNAVKFTEHGGITVRVSSTGLGDEAYQLRVEVEDTGIGIDRAGLDRLFHTFEQLEPGARIGGTGLGLAISRNFAQLMGGDLVVHSTPGVGSVFTFTFATTSAAVLPPEREARPASGVFSLGQRRPTALVVDDVDLNRSLLEELLSSVGFETRAASSGEEALAAHDSWSPDLVLLDLRMPGLGGLEACRRLKGAGSTARIVALSASGLDEDEPEARVAGADAFIRKPYDEAVLLRRIVELLGLTLATPGPVPTPPSRAAGRPPLAQLLASVPRGLLGELRAAALEARPARVEALAARVATHSESAAAAIHEALADFRYEFIISAVDAIIGTGGLAG